MKLIDGITAIKGYDFVALLVHFEYIMLYNYTEKRSKVIKIPEGQSFFTFGGGMQNTSEVYFMCLSGDQGKDTSCYRLTWKDYEEVELIKGMDIPFRNFKTFLYQDKKNVFYQTDKLISFMNPKYHEVLNCGVRPIYIKG